MKDKVKVEKYTLSKTKKFIHDKSLKIFFYSFIGSCLLSFIVMTIHLSIGLQVFIPSTYIILPLIFYVVLWALWIIFLHRYSNNIYTFNSDSDFIWLCSF